MRQSTRQMFVSLEQRIERASLSSRQQYTLEKLAEHPQWKTEEAIGLLQSNTQSLRDAIQTPDWQISQLPDNSGWAWCVGDEGEWGGGLADTYDEARYDMTVAISAAQFGIPIDRPHATVVKVPR